MDIRMPELDGLQATKKIRGKFPDLPIITIGMGEKIKTLETVQLILHELLSHDCDRSSFLIGIGGGLCGLAGWIFAKDLRTFD